MTRILCIHISDDNGTVVSIGDENDIVVLIGDDWYHMHIESCLERIAYIWVYVNMCIGELCDYVNWWLCALVKLGECWWLSVIENLYTWFNYASILDE